METTNHVLTVISPAGCITRINGELTNKIEIAENKQIEITVSKTGYKTFTQVIESLTEDTTINVDELEILKHKLIVVTEDSNTVKINDIEIREQIFDEFTPVTISVSCDGYREVVQTINKITEDTTLNIQLEKIYHTIKVNWPEGANCKINPELSTEFKENNALITVDEFTPVTVVISKTGYKTITKYYQTVKLDDEINVSTMEYETFKLTVKGGKNTAGAKLTLNGEKAIFGTENEIGTIGTEVTVKVEKEHYITYLETLVITEDTLITVNLEQKKYTVSVENIPEGAVANYQINVQKEKDYTVPFEAQSGSKVVITAKKPKYKDFVYVIDSLDKDYAIRVPEMELQKFNLTINTPESSKIILNGTEVKLFPQVFNYGDIVNIEVSKEHYQKITKQVVITKDTVLDINLELDQYELTVLSNPENAKILIVKGSEKYTDRVIKVGYGEEVEIFAELEGYEPFNEKIVILENTTRNIVLPLKMVKLSIQTKPIDSLSGALIKVDNNQIDGYETLVTYGQSHNITVSKPGYKTFTTDITPIKDTVVLVNNNGIFEKPAVSVYITNIDTITAKPYIKINGKPVGNGIAVYTDYDKEATIEVVAEGYVTIKESYNILDDFTLNYELVDINSGKCKVTVNSFIDDALVYINGVLRSMYYIEPNNQIHVVVKHKGYETIDEKFTITEDTVIEFNENHFVKKMFNCRIYTNPSTAYVNINGKRIDSKVVKVSYLTDIEYEVFADKYIPQSGKTTVTGDTKINVKLVVDPNYKHEGEEDIYGEGLDGIINMIKFRNYYTYLNIGRYLLNGLTEDNINKFYKEFGFYVSSKYDYMLWRKMHNYFGHDDNIQEPEKDK